MGLAGRKEKQRIPADPRNLSWADNAARFGQSYLSKLGWDPSKGLGAEGDGMKTHLKVTQKLDLLGIGAAHQKDPSGIAWKQSKDFEALLRRLNEGRESVRESGDAENDDDKDNGKNVRNEDEDARKKIKKEKKDNKRKRKEDGEGSDTKSIKRRKGTTTDADAAEEFAIVQPPSRASSPKSKFKGRPRAHRARIQASKNLASKSAAAISEILGIAPSSSGLPSTSASGKPTGADAVQAQIETLEKLTTSSKSVADYFKEKLDAKASSNTTSDFASTSRTPDDEEVGVRFGIGRSAGMLAQFFAVPSAPVIASVTPVSKAATPATAETTTDSNDEPPLTTSNAKAKKRKRDTGHIEDTIDSSQKDDRANTEQNDSIVEEQTEKEKSTKKRKSKHVPVDDSNNAPSSIPFPTSDEIIRSADDEARRRKKQKKQKKREREKTEAGKREVEAAVEIDVTTVEEERERTNDKNTKRMVDSKSIPIPSPITDEVKPSKDEKRMKKKPGRENLRAELDAIQQQQQSVIPFPSAGGPREKGKDRADRKAKRKETSS